MTNLQDSIKIFMTFVNLILRADKCLEFKLTSERFCIGFFIARAFAKVCLLSVPFVSLEKFEKKVENFGRYSHLPRLFCL